MYPTTLSRTSHFVLAPFSPWQTDAEEPSLPINFPDYWLIDQFKLWMVFDVTIWMKALCLTAATNRGQLFKTHFSTKSDENKPNVSFL